jgi:hypothetical protein
MDMYQHNENKLCSGNFININKTNGIQICLNDNLEYTFRNFHENRQNIVVGNTRLIGSELE